MESKKSNQESLSESSSEDYCEENYDWVEDENFPIEYKKEFLQFPLEEWKNMLYGENKTKNFFMEERNYYLDNAHKILEKDIFKGFNYYKESEVIKTKLDNYQTNINIKPDFFIYKIKKEKFIELLEQKKYMLRTKYKIDENIKYISIIGEIKLNVDKLLDKNQMELYFKFINNSKIDEEKILLMNVYDESFDLYEADKKELYNEEPMIHCFVANLCNKKFHEINFENLKEKQSKQDLENNNGRIEKQIDEYIKCNRILIILICVMVLIISLLLKNLYY